MAAKRSLRILMLGDSAVGKTSLVDRFCDDEFRASMTSTIGIDFKQKTVDIDGTRVKLTIWDTAGQERFRSLAKSYFKGADGVLLVYDITRQDSFEGVRRWLGDLREKAGDDVDVVLVGNKMDLDDQRTVESATGQALAGTLGASAGFRETSSRSGAGVQEAFVGLAEAALRRKGAKRAAAAAAASGGGGGKLAGSKSSAIAGRSGDSSTGGSSGTERVDLGGRASDGSKGNAKPSGCC